MNRWNGAYRPISKGEIYVAVQDPIWQDFRLSLKGLSTQEKLRKLAEYLDWTAPIHEQLLHEVQVINYLNALKRGGQLNDNLEVMR
jgi:hypothetical protein